MEEIAIITDTHAGIKNGSDIFLDYADRFYTEVFFPHLKSRGITKILHLGDYYDNRRVVNYKVLRRNREMFLEKLREYGMTMDIIPGNHDVAYKNTNDLCSLTEVLVHYPDVVNLYMQPTVVEYNGLRVALLPWINAENYVDSLNFIATADAPILGGHLELSGFEMLKGAPAISHGMDAELFKRYETVLSGHYHTKSQKGNINYLGVAFEQTWADCNDPKYFHILNTTTRELTAVRNDMTIFKRLVYDDTLFDDPIAAVARLDLTHVRGCFVKVIVAGKKDPYAFDKYLDKIIAQEPFEYKIVENLSEYLSENVSDDDVNISDTVTLLNTYVDAVDTDLNKDRIKRRLQELYIEAQTLDSI
jgi:DNA repair exonuclease SbcCD nuclease subunit